MFQARKNSATHSIKTIADWRDGEESNDERNERLRVSHQRWSYEIIKTSAAKNCFSAFGFLDIIIVSTRDLLLIIWRHYKKCLVIRTFMLALRVRFHETALDVEMEGNIHPKCCKWTTFTLVLSLLLPFEENPFWILRPSCQKVDIFSQFLDCGKNFFISISSSFYNL